jgi:hypothetical protein
MQQELQPYRPNDIIQYHKITFDFRTTEKFFKHTQAMTNLVEHIKHIEYERIEVFVYTHSETVQGDLWGGFEENETIGRGKSKKTILDAPVVYTVNHVSGKLTWLQYLTFGSFSQDYLSAGWRTTLRAPHYGCSHVAILYGNLTHSSHSKIM